LLPLVVLYALVVKISPEADLLLHSTYLGGESEEDGRAIKVDAGGNIYGAGMTSSSNCPRQNAHQTTLGGVEVAFVTKIDPAQNLLVYSTYLGGRSLDQGRGIAIDAAGNAYVTGQTFSWDDPRTAAED
jgi:hypothetical protein